jgi:glycosyltransferase involved in cell wall biosynthesis
VLQSMKPDDDVVVVDRRISPARQDSSIQVVEYGIPRWLVLLHQAGVPFAGAAEALLSFSAITIRGALELIRSPAAVIYVPTSEIPWVTLAGFTLARLFRRRLVLTNHNTRIEHGSVAFGLVGKILWGMHARADRVIAVSHAIAEELAAIDISNNVSVNSLGFSAEHARTLRSEAPPLTAFYIGRLETTKGIYDLLDVWGTVVRNLPSAKLVMAGYGTSSSQQRFLKARFMYDLDSAVDWLGVVSEEAKWSLIARSRVCLFLSHIEGWGIVPIEALSMGVPVVVYDLACYDESLKGLEGVSRVPIRDVHSAAIRVTELMEMSTSDYLELSNRIRSSFRYKDWATVASTELDLVLGRSS